MRSGEEHGVGQASRWRTGSHGSCGLALMKRSTCMKKLRREGKNKILRTRYESCAGNLHGIEKVQGQPSKLSYMFESLRHRRLNIQLTSIPKSFSFMFLSCRCYLVVVLSFFNIANVTLARTPLLYTHFLPPNNLIPVTTSRSIPYLCTTLHAIIYDMRWLLCHNLLLQLRHPSPQ